MREEAGLAKEKGLKREVSPRSRNFFSASPSFLFLCSPSFFSQSFLPQAPQVLSSCTESSRKSHPAFLLFQSFANLFLPLSLPSSFSLRFSYRSPEPLTYTFVPLVTFTWTLSLLRLFALHQQQWRQQQQLAAAAHSPNFETLTKSRAR